MVGIGLPGGPAPSPSSPGFPVWQVSAIAGVLLAGATVLAVARTAPGRRGRVMRLTGSRRAAAIGALAFVFAVAAFGVVAVTQSGGASGDASPACSVPGR